jgi:hypothetical protein
VQTEVEIIKAKGRNLMSAAKPSNPALWSRAKSAAKKKFDVYPSAYANAWASKWYKSKGGGWSGGNNKVASRGKSKSKKT